MTFKNFYEACTYVNKNVMAFLEKELSKEDFELLQESAQGWSPRFVEVNNKPDINQPYMAVVLHEGTDDIMLKLSTLLKGKTFTVKDTIVGFVDFEIRPKAYLF